jgi:hypothetical protein
MRLRDHPLMSYRGSRNWPPAWMWIGGADNTYPKGEMGILQEVVSSTLAPMTRCFLIVEYRASVYMGALLFNDAPFCRQVFGLLQNQSGRSIEQIGDLEVGHLL